MTEGQFLIGALRRDERNQHREGSDMNMHASIGHNYPMIGLGRDALSRLSAWLLDMPAIESPEQAREANEVLSATQRTLKDMDAERHAAVDPLNAEVKRINAEYTATRTPLERALDELKRRLTTYAIAEERARAAAAAALRAEAEAKERAAREAEAREADAMAAVDVGVCEDAGGAIADADARFAEYQRAARAAATAERNVAVRLRSVLGGNARTMRTTEVLSVTDAAAALGVIGVTDKISEAILSEARAHRRAHGALPPGISVQFVRSM